jgi:hypothetical protein
MRPFEFCVLGLSELACFSAQTLRCPQVHTDDCAKVVAMRDERRLRELVLGAYNGGGMYVGPWAQAHYEPMGDVMVRA